MREYFRKNPTITCIIAAVITLFFYYLVQFNVEMTLWIYTLREIVVGIIILIFIYKVAGIDAIKWSFKGIGFCFKKSWWLILLVVGNGTLSLLFAFKPSIVDSGLVYFKAIIVAAIFSFFVGIFEEGLFRGLILNASLIHWGKSRSGIMKACLLNAFLFGLLHLGSAVIAGEFTDFIALVTGILKVLQTGTIGFLFAVLYLRTRSFYGVVILHALNDYIPFAISFLIYGGISTNYVSSGSTGVNAILGLAIYLILYIPIIITAVKQIKYINIPQESFFIEFTPAHNISKK